MYLPSCTIVLLPDSFLNEEGRAGGLLGLESAAVSPTLQLSVETIFLVNVTLLTLDELRYINENGEVGRNMIAERLKQYQGKSFLSRPSVI